MIPKMFRDKFVVLVIISAVVVILAGAAFAGTAVSIDVTLTPDGFLPLILKEPAPVSMLPDLVIRYVSITLEDPTCYERGNLMGMRVFIDNIGLGDAGMFVVKIEDVAVMMNGLVAGESTSVWVDAYSSQPLAIVDATDLVVESNEDNNVFNKRLPVPTLPPPCEFLTPSPNSSSP